MKKIQLKDFLSTCFIAIFIIFVMIAVIDGLIFHHRILTLQLEGLALGIYLLFLLQYLSKKEKAGCLSYTIHFAIGKLMCRLLFSGIEWQIDFVSFLWMTLASLLLLILSFEPWTWWKA